MATYYAGIGGSDANAGTSWALRKLTIQAAVNIATTAGDTVYVGPGTFRETVTLSTSGTAGNPISLIGDYLGTLTSGSKGVVRITGSAADQTATRGNCIVASSKNYITIQGIACDICTSSLVSLTDCTNITIDKCLVTHDGAGSAAAISVLGASQAAITISNCHVLASSGDAGISFSHGATVDNTGHVVKSCIVMGAITSAAANIRVTRVGGITISNCYIAFGGNGVYLNTAVTAGQTVTVNNCNIAGHDRAALRCVAADGSVVENYNNLEPSNAVLRTNVTAGANSISRAICRDVRWFFEAVNGGLMVTPFDLASYSTLVELNSGTGAPSTDMRGASAVGTYREWGALEYDSTYDIEAGSAGGLITHPGMAGGMRG